MTRRPLEKPFESPVRSSYSPGQLTAEADQAIAELENALETILRPKAQRSFADTWEAFDAAITTFMDRCQTISLISSVSPDQATQNEAVKEQARLRLVHQGVFFREDLYFLLKKQEPHSSAQVRLFHETMRSFERNGLASPDARVAAEVRKLKDRLTTLETDYADHLNQDDTHVDFTAAELEGVPADLLSRLVRTGDRYAVTVKPADYGTVIENAQNPDTRRRLMVAASSRQAEKNLPLFEEALTVRAQIATLLGHRNWAEERLQGRMAPSADKAREFLLDLRKKLLPRYLAEQAELLEFKKTIEPGARELHPWDIAYLSNQLRKRDHDLDDERIREYFPSEHVMKTMLTIFSKLFELRFVKISNALNWAPEVALYEVRDTSSSPTGDPMAYFFADLLPRKGKYDHFAAFPIVSGRRLPDGYRKPMAAIVGNFEPPSGDRPSLLRHSDVETLFHEFGHILHHILTQAVYGSLSGFEVAFDFVEVASQLLENWAWHPVVLQQLSHHYRDGSKLPADLLKRMLAARNFMQASDTMTQIFYALLDLEYHSARGKIDSTTVYRKLYEEILLRKPLSEARPQANFGHFMGGYDAGYYGYLWSLVYADDLFTLFDGKKVLGLGQGAALREHFLSQGNMHTGHAICRKLLRRESNADAFLKKLGIFGSAP